MEYESRNPAPESAEYYNIHTQPSQYPDYPLHYNHIIFTANHNNNNNNNNSCSKTIISCYIDF